MYSSLVLFTIELHVFRIEDGGFDGEKDPPRVVLRAHSQRGPGSPRSRSSVGSPGAETAALRYSAVCSRDSKNMRFSDRFSENVQQTFKEISAGFVGFL